jgi:hypothetical protein
VEGNVETWRSSEMSRVGGGGEESGGRSFLPWRFPSRSTAVLLTVLLLPLHHHSSQHCLSLHGTL